MDKDACETSGDTLYVHSSIRGRLSEAVIQDFLESCYPGIDLKETPKFEILTLESGSYAVKFTNAADAIATRGYFRHTSTESIIFLPKPIEETVMSYINEDGGEELQ